MIDQEKIKGNIFENLFHVVAFGLIGYALAEYVCWVEWLRTRWTTFEV